MQGSCVNALPVAKLSSYKLRSNFVHDTEMASSTVIIKHLLSNILTWQ